MFQIEKDGHGAFCSREAADESGFSSGTECGRIINIAGGQACDFLDFVDEEASEFGRAGLSLSLHNDDAGAFGVKGSEAELNPKIDDRNDFSAKIDDAEEFAGGARNGSDFERANDFAHVQDIEAVNLFAEAKRENAAGGGFLFDGGA